MPTVLNYFLIREPTMGSVRVIHKTRDSAFAAFHEFIKDDDFDDCIELMEVVVNDRGRVIAEGITHSYSKVGRMIVTHVVTPVLRPLPARMGPPLVDKDGPLVPLTLGQ